MRIGILVFAFAVCGWTSANAQTGALTCSPSATNFVVRSEGLAEPLGDISLICTGTPGLVAGNITVTLPVAITNRLDVDNRPDAVLTVDTGSGSAPAGTVSAASNSLTFSNVAFTAPPSGRATIRISNLRAAVNQLGAGFTGSVDATLSSLGFALSSNTVTVATPRRGLLAGFGHGTITCTGSALPTELSFANLLATGTGFGSVRVTEGFQTVFQKKTGSAGVGTRIVVRYSGIPDAVRLFVPDAVAGSTALQPTAAGDLGLTPSAGRYAPGESGSLLLARVIDTDANGAGGTLTLDISTLGAQPVDLGSIGELSVQNGGAIAVYEVIDSSAVRESAQIPLFIGLGPTGGLIANIGATVNLGPLSADAATSATAPIPRFADVEPPSDCETTGDCVSTNSGRNRLQIHYPEYGLRKSIFGALVAKTVPQDGCAHTAPRLSALTRTCLRWKLDHRLCDTYPGLRLFWLS